MIILLAISMGQEKRSKKITDILKHFKMLFDKNSLLIQ